MTLSRSIGRALMALTFAACSAGAALAEADRPGGVAPTPPSGIFLGGEVFMNPAPLGSDVPREDILEAMVKAVLMTFNDANLTGNYDVLGARMHPEFREQVPPARLAAIFEGFRTNKVNLAPALVHKPVYTQPARLDANGVMAVSGYLDTRPWRTNFELAWRRSAEQWLLWKINVRVRPPDP